MTLRQRYLDLPRRERRQIYSRAFSLAVRDWWAWLAFLPIIVAFALAFSISTPWIRFVLFVIAISSGSLIWTWRVNRHLRELL